MDHIVIGLTLVCCTYITSCSALGISSKLDFDSLGSSSKLVGTRTEYKSVPITYSHLQDGQLKPNDDFEDIGIVCVSGEGCNKTKPNESKESIQTDIVVHVRTNVDSNKNNKTLFMEDIPDVPVVAGTPTNNFDEKQKFKSSRPLVVISPDDAFLPVSPSSLISHPSYSTSVLQTESLHKQKSDFPSIEPKIDINIKTLSPQPATFRITENGQSDTDFRYKTNGIELHVPHFEPSYHNHYFGENPPPQLIWYPKTSGLSNSEYKPKATFKPSILSADGTITTSSHKHYVGSGITCSCNKGATTGLQWYPRQQVHDRDPGSQINDKLAPLD